MTPTLIKCPLCEASISSAAASCPKCGQPINSEKNRSQFAGKIIIVVLFVICALGFLMWKMHGVSFETH